MAFRERERVILYTGLAAASLIALTTVARIAGASLGDTADKLGFTLVLAYLCLRLWGHATTLGERGVHERLAAVGRIGAPIVFLLLLAQTWRSSMGLTLTFGSLPMPEMHASTFARLEWSADIAFFGLFLVTAIAVWLEESEGVSRLLSLISYTVIGVFTLDLLAGAWGVVSLPPQLRLLGALFVLSVAGTIVVAILRRVERLDETELPAQS